MQNQQPPRRRRPMTPEAVSYTHLKHRKSSALSTLSTRSTPAFAAASSFLLHTFKSTPMPEKMCIRDSLTPIEYKLLCLLAKNVGKVLTHNFILKEVWGSACLLYTSRCV